MTLQINRLQFWAGLCDSHACTMLSKKLNTQHSSFPRKGGKVKSFVEDKENVDMNRLSTQNICNKKALSDSGKVVKPYVKGFVVQKKSMVIKLSEDVVNNSMDPTTQAIIDHSERSPEPVKPQHRKEMKPLKLVYNTLPTVLETQNQNQTYQYYPYYKPDSIDYSIRRDLLPIDDFMAVGVSLQMGSGITWRVQKRMDTSIPEGVFNVASLDRQEHVLLDSRVYQQHILKQVTDSQFSYPNYNASYKGRVHLNNNNNTVDRQVMDHIPPPVANSNKDSNSTSNNASNESVDEIPPQSKSSELSQSIVEMRTQLLGLSSKNIQLKAELSQVQLKCDRLSEVGRINDEILPLTEKLERDMSTKNLEVKHLQDIVTAETSKSQTLRSKLNAQEKVIEDLRKQLRHKEGLTISLEKKVVTAKDELMNAQVQALSMLEGTTDASSKEKEALVRIKDIEGAFTADMAAKTALCDDLQSQLTDARASVSALELDMNKLENSKENLQSQLEASQRTVEEQESTIAGLKLTFEQERRQLQLRHDLEEEAEKQRRSPLKDELQSKSDDLLLREKEVDALQREIDDLKEVLSRHETTISDNKETESVLEVRHKEMNSRHETLTNTLTEMESRLIAKEEGLKHASLEVENLKTELNAKDEELMMLLQSSVQSTEISGEKLLAAERKYIELENELNEARNMIDRLQSNESSRNSEVQMVREALTSEMQELASQNSILKQDLSKLQHMYDTNALVKTNVIGEEGSSGNSSDNDNGSDKDLSVKTQFLQDQLASLREGLTALCSLQDIKVASVQSLLSLITEDGEGLTLKDTGASAMVLQEANKTLTLERDTLSDTLQSTLSQLNRLQEDSKKNNDMLSRELQSSQATSLDLTRKLAEMSFKVDDLNTHTRKLEDDITKYQEEALKQATTIEELRALSSADESSIVEVESGDYARMTHKTLSRLINSSSDQQVVHLAKQVQQKENLLEEWALRYEHIEEEFRKAATIIEKARASKIRRYNKYTALQQDYGQANLQISSLEKENGDLKRRHKDFVRSVEEALIGGGAGTGLTLQEFGTMKRLDSGLEKKMLGQSFSFAGLDDSTEEDDNANF